MSLESEKGLLYEPAPPIPEWFTKEFEKIVPLCPNGVDRKIRFVWGMDRQDFCGGYWERRYGDTDNDPPKFIGRGRWVLEGWQSPDLYNREEWEKQSHLLGEFPVNGVFDFIAFHTTNTGGYLPLDDSALNHARIWAHWQGQERHIAIEEILRQKHETRVQRYRERKAQADRIATQFGEDVVRCLENAVGQVSINTFDPVDRTEDYQPNPGGFLVKDRRRVTTQV